MPEPNVRNRQREIERTVLWLRSRAASAHLSVAMRRMEGLLRKYRPDQPRVPAGSRDGGRWTREGSTGAAGRQSVRQEMFSSARATGPWAFFLNTYSGDALAAQLAAGRDGMIVATEWDTARTELWSARQTLTNADREIVTTTALLHDGAGLITIGPGGDGKLAVAATGDGVALTPVAAALPGTIVHAPAEGEVLRPLTANAMRILGSGSAAGAGALVVGMTAFSSPAGGASYEQLSDDVRLRFADDGRPPVIEQRIDPSWTDRFTGGTWQRLSEVPVTRGEGGALVIDGDRLRGAIGQERFDALGKLGGGDVFLPMQPVPLAPRDVPAGSIFSSGAADGTLHALPGTVVDWSQSYAQANSGHAPVLEIGATAMQGLDWSNGQARPRIGPLPIPIVDAACPLFSTVHNVAVSADQRVRALHPGLGARDLGTEIHNEIANVIKQWPGVGTGHWSELGLFMGVDQAPLAVLPRGASRIDVLEDAGNGTVCVYDVKTGDGRMSQRQMRQYWQEARLFRTGVRRLFVIPLYTKP